MKKKNRNSQVSFWMKGRKWKCWNKKAAGVVSCKKGCVSALEAGEEKKQKR